MRLCSESRTSWLFWVSFLYSYQRYLIRLMTRRATLYTEMFVGETLLHHHACNRIVQLRMRGSASLCSFDESEHPIVAQLGGSNKYKLLEAAKILEKAGYDEINLNCGCPSPRVSVALLLSPDSVEGVLRGATHAFALARL